MGFKHTVKKITSLVTATTIIFTIGTMPSTVQGAVKSDWKTLSTGDQIYFGVNRQYNNEPILWRVMETDGKIATLMSEYILENRAYDSRSIKVGWADSDICHYLNDTSSVGFLGGSFTAQEQEAILPQYSTKEEIGATEWVTGISYVANQKVVLPSVSEVKDGGTWGFANDEDRIALHVDPVKKSDSNNDSTYYFQMWWLRDPSIAKSSQSSHAFYVANYAFLEQSLPEFRKTLTGTYANTAELGIRPVIKINIADAGKSKLEVVLTNWKHAQEIGDAYDMVYYELRNHSNTTLSGYFALVVYSDGPYGKAEIHYLNGVNVASGSLCKGSFMTEYSSDFVVKGTDAILIQFEDEEEQKEFDKSFPYLNREVNAPFFYDYWTNDGAGLEKWFKDTFDMDLKFTI